MNKGIILGLPILLALAFMETGTMVGCTNSTGVDSVFVVDTTKFEGVAAYGKLKYVGSEECKTCHESHYDRWIESGHPYKLNKVVDGKPPTYPDFVPPLKLPDDLTWDDVTYVIGGYGWKARFIDKKGYIHTKDGKNQFNLADGSFSDYHKDEEKPYDCGSCHTTGYDPDAESQDSLPGIVGAWAFPGIQCEECHGAGSYHVDSKGLIPAVVNNSSTACGSCHIRGDREEIPASGGYIRHHEQFNEMVHSKKAGMDCVSCHDPHSSVVYDSAAPGSGVRVTCENCHAQQVITYREGSPGMDSAGVGCIDCHMAKVSKSAKAGAEYIGDVRTHLFRIDIDTSFQQFSEDGKLANQGISLDFACLSCHADTADDDMPESLRGRDRAWAAAYARSVHRAPNDVPAYYIGKDACKTCHQEIYAVWDTTAHAEDFRNNTTNPAGNTYDFIHGFGGSCQACHVTGYGDPTGWQDIALRDGATTADSMRMESVQCEACHGPSSQHAMTGQVKFKDTDVDWRRSCQRCHVATFDELADHNPGPADSAEVFAHPSGPHHPQALIFQGVLGYEYPGVAYQHSTHNTVVKRGCVECHLNPAGGHDLWPDPEACKSCHSDFEITATAVGDTVFDFDYRGTQDTVASLAVLLEELLDRALDAAADSTDTAAVKNWFPYRAAVYNLGYVEADKSYGIHDYKYLKGLLESSVADSSNYLDVPALMAQVDQDAIDQAVADSIAQAVADSLEEAKINALIEAALDTTGGP